MQLSKRLLFVMCLSLATQHTQVHAGATKILTGIQVVALGYTSKELYTIAKQKEARAVQLQSARASSENQYESQKKHSQAVFSAVMYKVYSLSACYLCGRSLQLLVS